MQALAKAGQGDLPDLLDTLTIAVTTLEAVGVESYRQLYLYVMGTTSDDLVRDLRVEDGRLIVGPPAHGSAHYAFMNRSFDADQRAVLLAELGNIMRIWNWAPQAMASYLGCSEAMLSTWIARPACTEVPVLPRIVVERIKRLSIIDQTRFLSGISDQEMPRWLSRKRDGFGQRSIGQVLQTDEAGGSFIQLVLWSLNSPQHASAIN